MEKINKCLKEWNATIEALGQGKQTILIRKYKTNINKFLLYPTISYALKDNYVENFQGKHKVFVEKNSLPDKKGNKILIKYFSTVEKIIKKPISKIPSDKYYIWTRNHVKAYINNNNPFIWVLRVYKLKNPQWVEPTPRGVILYANLKEKISLEGIEPVLNDSEFFKILDNL